MTYDTIIIGGGLSGLTAARELAQFGLKICLLEARGRLGGQIHTIEDEQGSKIELGAMVLYGKELNPLQPIIHRFGVPLVPLDPLNSDMRDNEQKPIPMPEMLSRIETDLRAAVFTVQEAKRIALEHKTDNAYIPPTLAEVLNYRKDNVPEISSKAYWTRKWVTASLKHHTHATLQDLSLLNLMQDPPFQGQPQLILGADQIFEELKKEALSTHNLTIQLRSAVTAVEKSKSQDIFVITTVDKQQYQAKTVLCAVPLGVLKNNKIHFEPKLSDQHRNALQYINMGQQNKILLEFSRPFWPEEVQFLYPNDPNIEFWPEYLNLHHFSQGKSHALLACFYGAQANFGKKSEETLLKMALDPLKAAYPKAELSLKRYKTTQWDVASYSLGSGSYFSTHATENHLQALNRVYDSKESGLFFAGDYKAGLRGLQGTLEGAFTSGIEAALDITSLLRNAQRKTLRFG